MGQKQSRMPLPEELAGRPFSVREARGQGIERGRTRGADLAAPFSGIRVPASWPRDEPVVVARAYAPRLREGQALCGVSAAALWGLPLPSAFAKDSRAHIAVREGRHRPTARGVVAREIRADLWDVVEIDGTPVTSPLLTLATLAGAASAIDLAIVADALRSGAENYPGLAHHRRALATGGELDVLVERYAGHTGVDKLRKAVGFSRDRVESPMETFTRWVLVEEGRLPEPEINVAAFDGRGRFLGRPDLSYPWARVAIEYDGDHHRSDRDQWRRDHDRRDGFADAGWFAQHLTYAQLRPSPARVVSRIRQALDQAK